MEAMVLMAGAGGMGLPAGAGVTHHCPLNQRSLPPHELRLKATEKSKTIFRIGFITSVFCVSKLASARGALKLNPAAVPGRCCNIY